MALPWLYMPWPPVSPRKWKCSAYRPSVPPCGGVHHMCVCQASPALPDLQAHTCMHDTDTQVLCVCTCPPYWILTPSTRKAVAPPLRHTRHTAQNVSTITPTPSALQAAEDTKMANSRVCDVFTGR
jgi:hypothetical protein